MKASKIMYNILPRQNSFSIETGRLLLTPLTAGELRLWLDEPDRLGSELGCKISEPPEGEFRDIVVSQQKITESAPGNFLWHTFWLMIRKSDRVSVGSFDFKAPPENGRVELGYGLDSGFEHNGYMTETVDAACRFAFSKPGISEVIAETELWNLPSQRVLARCGFSEVSRGDTVWWAKPLILETERLILRPWRSSDADELYRYAGDPETGPLCGWRPHTSVEDSRLVIEKVLSEPDTFAVVLKETGKPVGSVGVMQSCAEGALPSEREVGYWLGKPYRGRGLIPEAVEALLYRCFEVYGCPAVWCGYFDGNSRSLRVQEKCGFKPHHTEYDVPRAQLGDTAVIHYTRLGNSEWRQLRFFREFLRSTGRDSDTPIYENFYFGNDERSASELLALVLDGKKTATSSSLYAYESDGSEPPKPGDLSIVTDFSGEPRCVIETTAVTVVPFDKMTFDLCRREGEDVTLEGWREGHIRFFTADAKLCGYSFDGNMPVAFEDFRVVYRR